MIKREKHKEAYIFEFAHNLNVLRTRWNIHKMKVKNEQFRIERENLRHEYFVFIPREIEMSKITQFL